MSDSTQPSQRRRLPTKTRSGIIKLPPDPPDDDDFPMGSPTSQQAENQVETPSECSSDTQSSADIRTTASCHTAACSTSSHLSPEPEKPRTYGGYGGPKRCVKPPSITGPLNASTAPQVQSLPVKRRGSYQSLKRHNVSSQNNIESEDAPSVITMLKKATHWERFGTILVQVCTQDRHDDTDGVMQMLSAEGYDTEVCETQADALVAFSAKEVFPDIVVLDTTHSVFSTMQMIKQLQAKNPTVAVLCLGSTGPDSRIDAVTALQGGAADFMFKPLDLDELVARIERHVQRQHCIKLELETALEDAKMFMSQMQRQKQNCQKEAGLGAVAETDFEEQITELSDENSRLGAKLQEMALQNKMLEEALETMDTKIDTNSAGAHGLINQVSEQEYLLRKRVEELERMVQIKKG